MKNKTQIIFSGCIKNFPQNIIESHAHIGKFFDKVHGKETALTPQQIFDTLELNNGKVKKIIVSDITGLQNVSEQNNQSKINEDCYKTCIKEGKNKLLPLAICQVQNNSDIDLIIFKKQLQNQNFFGLKFHPTLTNYSIKDNEENYKKYLEIAQNNKLPCFFHSTTDGFSNPEYIINLAKNYPKLPIVLYHIDLTGDKKKALDLISNSLQTDNTTLFVDLSWINDKSVIKYAIDKIGEDRILFGTDTPVAEMGQKENYEKHITNIVESVNEYFDEKKEPQKAKDAVNKIFYKNADKLCLENKSPNIYEPPSDFDLILDLLTDKYDFFIDVLELILYKKFKKYF